MCLTKGDEIWLWYWCRGEARKEIQTKDLIIFLEVDSSCYDVLAEFVADENATQYLSVDFMVHAYIFRNRNSVGIPTLLHFVLVVTNGLNLFKWSQLAFCDTIIRTFFGNLYCLSILMNLIFYEKDITPIFGNCAPWTVGRLLRSRGGFWRVFIWWWDHQLIGNGICR